MVRTDPEPAPYFAHGLERRLAQLRVRRQAEIVVRREIDDRLVIEGRVRGLFAFEHAQLAIQALLLE